MMMRSTQLIRRASPSSCHPIRLTPPTYCHHPTTLSSTHYLPPSSHLHPSTIQTQHHPTITCQLEPRHHSRARARTYVTHSKTSSAKIIDGPIHPLTPPTTPVLRSPPIDRPTIAQSGHQNSTIPSSNSNTTQIIDPKENLTQLSTDQHTRKNSNHPPHVNQLSNPADRLSTEDPNQRVVVKLNRSRGSLTIDSEELGIKNLEISYLWLRDSCQSDHSVDPRTKQKLFKSSDIPLEIHPVESKVVINPQDSEPELLIKWSHNLNNPGSDQSHESSRFKLSFLRDLNSPRKWESDRQRMDFLKPKLWWTSSYSSENQNSIQKGEIDRLKERDELFIDYQAFKNDSKLQKLGLERLNSLGIVFFKNLNHPSSSSLSLSSDHYNKSHEEEAEDHDHEFELNRLIKTFGIDIRRTFYGDLWDVISLGQQAKNVANTNLSLDFHMDLVHFENPPRFQFLHCLTNEVQGGSSRFLDSYSVIERLLKKSPESFKTLVKEPIGFEYINDNHHTYFKHPTIQLRPNASLDQILNDPNLLIENLAAVNYSPPFQSPFLHPYPKLNPSSNSTSRYDLEGENGIEGFNRMFKIFNSLKTFEKLFEFESNKGFTNEDVVGVDSKDSKRSENFNSPHLNLNHQAKEQQQNPNNNNNPLKFEIRLEVGQAVGFDNRRILHSRTKFNTISNSKSESTKIQRWLKGAYVDGDSVWDRIRILNSNSSEA